MKYLLDQTFRQESQHSWLLKLTRYDYLVEYKKGKENLAADALSRRSGESTEENPSLASGSDFLASSITIVQPRWLSAIQKMVKQSPYLETI